MYLCLLQFASHLCTYKKDIGAMMFVIRVVRYEIYCFLIKNIKIIWGYQIGRLCVAITMQSRGHKSNKLMRCLIEYSNKKQMYYLYKIRNKWSVTNAQLNCLCAGRKRGLGTLFLRIEVVYCHALLIRGAIEISPHFLAISNGQRRPYWFYCKTANCTINLVTPRLNHTWILTVTLQNNKFLYVYY